ncbi:MAG: response regulator [Chloroflexaceae bacterium]|nr:response regulator [Chloroflexaceae bacterium]NJO05154.1 response regulator [Chloroflexaceae bacterium]
MTNTALEGVRILVVEDTADVALGLSEGLRRAGALTVEIKASARQARRRLEQEPLPDLVLLDQHITGEETGLDIALWMREQPALQQIVRVSYSGTNPEDLRTRCPDDTVFHALITKPIPIPQLIEKLAALLHHAPSNEQ